MDRHQGFNPKTGQAQTVVNVGVFSAPGMGISQERWDEIFGKRISKPYYKCKIFFMDSNKWEEESWYESIDGEWNVIYTIHINGKLDTRTIERV